MSVAQYDAIWLNARLFTASHHGIIEDGALAIIGDKIAYCGTRADLPPYNASQTYDCAGRWITPGLIDCHTHLVFGGNRANEFEMRLNGATYEQIAKAGGGIVSTVKATRETPLETLIEQALPRLDCFINEGITTIEIKSGYGLDTKTEVKMLKAARALAKKRGVNITTTFLGAHALPLEANGDKDAYIDLVCNEMLPAIVAECLADSVDAFCEGIGFSVAQTRRVFEAAHKYNLPVKLHAEQLSNLGGAIMAAEFNAQSCDHIEYIDEAGVKAMAGAGSVAVLLPGAYYFIREKQKPPVSLFRAHNVPMALASDCNPGSSPMLSLLLTLNMGATLFSMTVQECLEAVTINAAKALGQAAHIGSLETGKFADFAIWNVENINELVYFIGRNPLHQRIFRGKA
jgi:imidazolonepropionase